MYEMKKMDLTQSLYQEVKANKSAFIVATF
jgi:hypothetical protein